VLDAVREAAAAGSTLLSVCSGAFVLGAAGLLDDRRCTTHWENADELRRRFPRAHVDPDVLFVDDGNLITSRNPNDIPAFSKALIAMLQDAKVAEDA